MDKSSSKRPKLSILARWKPETCGQTVLPEGSISIGQKMANIFSDQSELPDKNQPWWKCQKNEIIKNETNSFIRQVNFNLPKLVENVKMENWNATFWVIFKQCEKVGRLSCFLFPNYPDS